MKSFDIMGHQVNKAELDNSDIIIRPKIKGMSLLETGMENFCATQGYNEIKKNIEGIKKALEI
ncbi:hypothetical protein D3C73_1173660 [compost metagenome]